MSRATPRRRQVSIGSPLTLLLLGVIASPASAQVEGEGSCGADWLDQAFRFGGRDDAGELMFDQLQVRYRISRLLGEPVETLRTRYTFNREVGLRLRGHGGELHIQGTGPSGSDGRFRSGGGVDGDRQVNIVVSPETFDLLRVIGVDVRLRIEGVDRSWGIDGTLLRRDPGLLAPPGQWGWDFPGSPNWGALFEGVSSPERARSRYEALAEASRPASLEVLKINVDAGALLDAIARQLPGALVSLYRPSLDGQAAALLQGLSTLSARANAPGLDRLQERLRATGRFFDHFRDRLDPALWDAWEERRQALEGVDGMRQVIQALEQRVAGAVNRGALKEARRQLDALRETLRHMPVAEHVRWARVAEALEESLAGRTVYLVVDAYVSHQVYQECTIRHKKGSLCLGGSNQTFTKDHARAFVSAWIPGGSGAEAGLPLTGSEREAVDAWARGEAAFSGKSTSWSVYADESEARVAFDALEGPSLTVDPPELPSR